MQKRFRVGTGPSSNTCPRWAEHLEHRTSVRTKPGRVKTSNIFAPTLISRTKSIHQSHIFTYHIEQWMIWVHPNLMFTELVSWEWCCRQASSSGRGERPAAASRRSTGRDMGQFGLRGQMHIIYHAHSRTLWWRHHVGV